MVGTVSCEKTQDLQIHAQINGLDQTISAVEESLDRLIKKLMPMIDLNIPESKNKEVDTVAPCVCSHADILRGYKWRLDKVYSIISNTIFTLQI
jgi:SMC interacting uncharacterized protein involved in chromosome segregation